MRMKVAGMWAAALWLGVVAGGVLAQDTSAQTPPPQQSSGTLGNDNTFDPNQPIKPGFYISVTTSSQGGVEMDLRGPKPPDSAGAFSARVRELSGRVKQLASAVHGLSHRLHPSNLEQLGLLTAVRGDAEGFRETGMSSVLKCGRGRHSAKPEQVRAMIERASPGPYLELFGRLPAAGWTVFGNEVERNLFSLAPAAPAVPPRHTGP